MLTERGVRLYSQLLWLESTPCHLHQDILPHCEAHGCPSVSLSPGRGHGGFVSSGRTQAGWEEPGGRASRP